MGEGRYKLLKHPLVCPLWIFPSLSSRCLISLKGECLHSSREHVPVGSLQWNKLSLETNEWHRTEASSSCFRRTACNALAESVFMLLTTWTFMILKRPRHTVQDWIANSRSVSTITLCTCCLNSWYGAQTWQLHGKISNQSRKCVPCAAACKKTPDCYPRFPNRCLVYIS